jgi:PII-like signaling protein
LLGLLAVGLGGPFTREPLSPAGALHRVQGFGVKHHLRTDRILTLSEDLPLVSVAVDTSSRIESALAEVNELSFDGLVTLERARMIAGRIGTFELPPHRSETIKLTVYVGRHERARGKPAYEAVVDLLHRRGVAGATVLLGVDGTARGVRERATFFGRNTRVPLMIIAVAEGQQVVELLPELSVLLPRPLLTFERVRVCKRDGRTLADPHPLRESDPSGRAVWQKLMVYAGEQARAEGDPLHHRVITDLRSAGAPGATRFAESGASLGERGN